MGFLKNIDKKQAFQVGKSISSRLLGATPTLRKAGHNFNQVRNSETMRTLQETSARWNDISQIAQKTYGIQPNSTASKMVDVAAMGITAATIFGVGAGLATYGVQGAEGNSLTEKAKSAYKLMQGGMPQAVDLTHKGIDGMIGMMAPNREQTLNDAQGIAPDIYSSRPISQRTHDLFTNDKPPKYKA